MRRVSLDRSHAGIRIARTILSLEGIVLLSAGCTLSEEIIENLEKHKITEIYIDDDHSRGIPVPETIREEIVTEVKAQIKQIMRLPTTKISIDSEKVINLVEKLMISILADDFIILSLSDIRSVDDYTYSHSVNVCILSVIIAFSMGFKGEKLRDIGVGALLHDIGKVMISDEILKKPSSLTINEYAEVKRHTVCGYDILRNSRGISPTAHVIALSHHERIDGSGYPYNLKNNEIPLPAKIVAAADVYDALTTDRIYRKKMRPNEVVDYMTSLAGKHFDKAVLDALICHIACFPVGTAVVLNSGEKGLVSRYNPKTPNRPIIRIVMNKNGETDQNGSEVDLSRQPDYRITELWDI